MRSYHSVGEKLIGLLAKGGDLEAVLKECGVTPKRAMAILRQGQARHARRAQLVLGRLQAQLLGARFSPSAVTHLVRVMHGKHQSAALGAALRVLEVGMKKGKGRAVVEEKEGEGGATEGGIKPEEVGPYIKLLEEIGKRGKGEAR